MKQISIILATAGLLVACTADNKQPPANTNVTVVQPEPSPTPVDQQPTLHPVQP